MISSKTGYKLLSIEEKRPENKVLIVSKITSVILDASSKVSHPNYTKLLIAAKIKSVAKIKA